MPYIATIGFSMSYLEIISIMLFLSYASGLALAAYAFWEIGLLKIHIPKIFKKKVPKGFYDPTWDLESYLEELDIKKEN